MSRLSIHDLCLERGGRAVLRDFSAELASGEALLLQGRNGSGKTSLLRALAGLLTPVKGAMLWDGAPLAQDWRPEGGRIAYLGHQDGVKGGLSVAENVDFWAGLLDQESGEGALEALDLTPIQNRPARILSAGQRRRLALSRLLLGQWDLWLLDEPTSALDKTARATLLAMVVAHLGQGGMAVIASHEALDLPGPNISLPDQPE